MKKLVVLLAVISVFFTACSSDTTIETTDTAPTAESSDSDAPDDGDDANAEDDSDDTEGSDDAADEPTAEPTDEPTATTAPATQEPTATSEPADSSADADPIGPSPEQEAAIQAVTDADDWCQAADAIDSGTLVLDTLDFTNPAALELGFTQALRVVSAAEGLAPPEIAADVSLTIEAFSSLAAALEDVNWSFIDLELGVIEQFDDPMQLATYNIEKYNFEVCGIGTDPGDPPTEDELLTPPTDDVELDGTIRDQAIPGLVEAGFTEAEANCIIDGLDLSDPAALQDTTAIFNVFTECGISLDRLAELGGGLSG